MGIFNISRLDEFGTCEQKYAHRYEPSDGFPYGCEEIESEETSVLTFGTAIHEGLRAMYAGTNTGDTYTEEGGGDGEGGRLGLSPDQSLVKGVIAERGPRRLIVDMPTILTAYRAAIGEHELAGFGERLLRHYVERYAQVDGEWEVLAVEEEWEVGVGPVRYRKPDGTYYTDMTDRVFVQAGTVAVTSHTLVGRWDLVVRSPIGGGTIWHVQHKTTGASSLPLYATQYDLAWHERAYALAIRERWPGLADHQYAGTILNLIRRPAKNNFGKNVDFDKDFHRYHVSIDRPLIDRFVREAVQRMDRIEERRRSGVWEQNWKACKAHPNADLCTFHAECCGIPVDRESAYRRREPDYVDLMTEGKTMAEAVEIVATRKTA